jgi:hypothetical protein
LLANNEVKRHKTSKKELDSIRAVIVRDLADASETEAQEIVKKAKEFVDMVEQWIAKTHVTLKA